MNYTYHGEIDKDLICSICDEPFTTPVNCSRCGVSFCHPCLSKWLETNASRKTCPTCRNSLSEGIPNRSLANICDKLQVKCEFNRCPWVGQRTQLASHIPSCKYRVVPCDHDGCGVLMSLAEKQAHEKSCEWRVVTCKCEKSICFREMHNHKTKECSSSMRVLVHQLQAEVQQLRADVRQLRAENTQSQRELEQVRREQTAQKACINGFLERIDSIKPHKNEEEDALPDFLTKAAEEGDSLAQLHLGIYLQYEKNMKEEAVRWYRESANQGNADAQFRLGCYYYDNGDEDKKSLYEAIKWYKRAADQNHASALVRLGECFSEGMGVKLSAAQAAKCYKTAAEKGSTEAQVKLGTCYFDGEGTEKNEFTAVKWYRRAAEQGAADGQFMLGECYSNGDGVKRKSHEEAAKWYRKAADQGDAEAQYNLGKCYESGKGVAQNTEEAYNWFRKAAEKGNQDALSALEDDDSEEADSSNEEYPRYHPYDLEDDLYDTY